MSLFQRSTVSCRLVGQLGNQLFTYFAALSYACSQEKEVRVGAFFATRTDGEVAIKHCVLPGFRGLYADCPNLSALAGASRREGLHVRLANGFQRLAGKRVYRSPVIGYNGPLTDLDKASVVLDGYFQTYHYVEEVRRFSGLTRPEMVTAARTSTWLNELRKRSANVAPIGLHIRAAGDYQRAGIWLNLAKYLSEALQIVDSDAQSPIWVFTDNEAYARRMLPSNIHRRTEFITAPPRTQPVQVMLALASTDRLVIANSSFSWWSGYLSGHDQVVAPKPWMPVGEMSEPSFVANLVLPGWRTVQASFHEPPVKPRSM